ncbi:hypothetical protein MJO29_015485 [Puccinia striiformis f. sp. tritici]|nr:hypothetical protein Pst134EB_029759 [Puccinia striiformis f. sp. tritici]KAI7936182.1 hypothetical protein MJO29_015485 [Puccinia striiformis f. sp. tritici]KAI9617199.1 hypothetical protein H4Q26_013064 [Puccinia striiformis f. sp. tritici PST-130]
MSSLCRSSKVLETCSPAERVDRPKSSRISIWVFMRSQYLSLYFLLVSIILLFPHVSAQGSPFNTPLTGGSNSNPTSYVAGSNSNLTSSASGTGSNPTDPRPQCSFHQSMYANTANGAVPDSRTTTEHGIKVPDCYEALGHLLHDRNGGSMFHMNSTGTAKRKSCGTCRIEIEGNYGKELFVPLDTVMFGTNQDRSGGLNGLFINCHKRGGQITLQAGGKLLTSIRIDVSKSTNSPVC